MAQSASLSDDLPVAWRGPAGALGPFVVAVIYFLGAELAFFIGTLSDNIFAPFWPPNVVLFCALVLVPERRWWIYILAVFPAHAVAELGAGMQAAPLIVAFATNCLVALANAFAVRRLIGGPPWFGDLRKAALYVLLVAGVNPGLVALGGAFVPILSGGPLENFWLYVTYWYAANALPSLTIGPAILVLLGEVSRAWLRDRWRLIETLVIGLTLVIVCAVAFRFSLRVIAQGFLPIVLYSPLPLVLWATVRFGARGAGMALLLVTIVLIGCALQGPSLFLNADPEANVLALQLFLIGLSIPTLLLGGAIDGLRNAERNMRKLAVSVLKAQDEERRRIARELHDSTGQNLIAMGMLLRQIRGRMPDGGEGAVAQIDRLVRQSVEELRTMSYLLHPPLLDEAGLQLALRHYLDGVTRRSKVRIDLDMPADLPRLAGDIELALFRVAQEALANVIRHSGSASARVSLRRVTAPGDRRVVLTVEDEGRISRRVRAGLGKRGAATGGVGLASMQERLQQIGGSLSIAFRPGGTTVTATVPERIAL